MWASVWSGGPSPKLPKFSALEKKLLSFLRGKFFGDSLYCHHQPNQHRAESHSPQTFSNLGLDVYPRPEKKSSFISFPDSSHDPTYFAEIFFYSVINPRTTLGLGLGYLSYNVALLNIGSFWVSLGLCIMVILIRLIFSQIGANHTCTMFKAM